MITRGQFARAFLPRVGAPVTTRNMLAMMSWIQAEGDAGRFNPLNTTQDAPRATVFNSVGVKNYAGFWEGVRATAETLNFGARRGEHGYREIRHALHVSDHPEATLFAVEASAWGTGGLALRVYRTTPNATLLGEYKRRPIVQ